MTDKNIPSVEWYRAQTLVEASGLRWNSKAGLRWIVKLVKIQERIKKDAERTK